MVIIFFFYLPLLLSPSFSSFSTVIFIISSSQLSCNTYYYHFSTAASALVITIILPFGSRIYPYHALVNSPAIHANPTTNTAVLINILRPLSSFLSHPLRQQEPQQLYQSLGISITESLPDGYVLASSSREPIKDARAWEPHPWHEGHPARRSLDPKD